MAIAEALAFHKGLSTATVQGLSGIAIAQVSTPIDSSGQALFLHEALKLLTKYTLENEVKIILHTVFGNHIFSPTLEH